MNDMSMRGFAPRKEPIFFIPAVVLALIGLLLAIQAGLGWIDEAARDDIYVNWGFSPLRLTLMFQPGWVSDLVARAHTDPDALAFARVLRDSGYLLGGPRIWTLATYAFLHGSWTHVGVNCIWLVAFGPPIARRVGAVRFLLFFVLTSVGGALAQWAVSLHDIGPMIGASAADSGLMAGAARFIFQPGAPLGGGGGGFSARFAVAGLEPRAATLRELFTDRRAVVFIVIWMATNFLFGAGAQSLGASDAPIAWVAHVGGFLSGLLLFPLFDRASAAPEAL